MPEDTRRVRYPAVFLHRPLAEMQEHIGRLGVGQRPVAIYFDRDGVLNEFVLGEYVHKPEDIIARPDAHMAMRIAMGLTPLVFVMSNQAGVAGGYFTMDDLERTDDALWRQTRLQPMASIYCVHDQDGDCECRKPGTRMIEVARDIAKAVLAPINGGEPGAEIMLGDFDSDEEMARDAGVEFGRVSDERGALATLQAVLARLSSDGEGGTPR